MKNKEEIQKSIIIGDYVVVINLPNTDEDLRYSKGNNIVCIKSGEVAWEIEQLLKRYSKKNHLMYLNDMYFDIIKENEEKIRCIGFINHCIIDVCQQEIISIINNC